MNDPKPVQDDLLKRAAGTLLAAGEDDAAAALVASKLAIEFGSSWWDGHDDYIYDVMIAITTTPGAAQHLHAAQDAVRRALGGAAGHFRDERGEWCRGSLVKVDVVIGAVAVDEQRLLQRQRGAEEHANAMRNLGQ